MFIADFKQFTQVLNEIVLFTKFMGKSIFFPCMSITKHAHRRTLTNLYQCIRCFLKRIWLCMTLVSHLVDRRAAKAKP